MHVIAIQRKIENDLDRNPCIVVFIILLSSFFNRIDIIYGGISVCLMTRLVMRVMIYTPISKTYIRLRPYLDLMVWSLVGY